MDQNNRFAFAFDEVRDLHAVGVQPVEPGSVAGASKANEHREYLAVMSNVSQHRNRVMESWTSLLGQQVRQATSLKGVHPPRKLGRRLIAGR